MRYEDLRLEPDSHGLPCRLAWPLPCNGIRDLQVLCLPLLQRPGGFMVCVPEVIHASILADLQGPEPLDAVGPYRLESLETIDEDEAGEEHLTGIQCPALLVDLDESMLARMEPFDPVTDITVTSFMEGAPQLVWRPDGGSRARRATGSLSTQPGRGPKSPTRFLQRGLRQREERLRQRRSGSR